MRNNRYPSVELVRLYLKYDSDTGDFYWQNRVGKAKHYNGKIAGRKDKSYYSQIMLLNKVYPAHVIAWIHYYGEYPTEEIDHIDRNKSHNAIANLRLATRSENMFNKINGFNPTGTIGVKWYPQRGKYQATIQKDKIQYHLGYFDDIEKAIAARQKAALELFGNFADA